MFPCWMYGVPFYLRLLNLLGLVPTLMRAIPSTRERTEGIMTPNTPIELPSPPLNTKTAVVNRPANTRHAPTMTKRFSLKGNCLAVLALNALFVLFGCCCVSG
jgi:hypothetical protein